MADPKTHIPDQVMFNGFASVIELRAYVQAEFERIKADIDSLYTVTAQIREEEARRDERVAHIQHRVDDLDHRIQDLTKIISGCHIDDTKIQSAIATRLELFKKDLDIARLSSKVEEQQGPTSAQSLSLRYSTMQTELADHIEDGKSKSKKIEQMEKELNELKTTVSNLALRLTIIVAIAGFALGKGADLVIKYLVK